MQREDSQRKLTKPQVKRIETGFGSSRIEPPFDSRWDTKEKMAWHAAVAEIDSGLTIEIYSETDVLGHTFFSVNVGTSSVTATTYERAWIYINGVVTGAEQLRDR